MQLVSTVFKTLCSPKKMSKLHRSRATKCDDYVTPPWVWQILKPFIPPETTLWEGFPSSCLTSVRALQQIGEVVVTEGDFFDVSTSAMCITNPPFSIKFKALERLLQTGNSFSLLIPAWCMACATVRKLVHKYSFEPHFIMLPKRIHFLDPETLQPVGKAGWDSVFVTRGLLTTKQLTYT